MTPARPPGRRGGDSLSGAGGTRQSGRRSVPWSAGRRRILVIDPDPGLSSLIGFTLPADEFEVVEAGSAEEARSLVERWRPALVLLDAGLAGADGLDLCAELTQASAPPIVILLTGAQIGEVEAARAGAAAVLRKPVSPLELLGLLDRLENDPEPSAWVREPLEEDRLRAYARDLNRVIAVERAQRRLFEHAYRQTVTALAAALEARETGSRLHGVRVMRYAFELAGAVEPELLADATLVYGFLLHDIGKIDLPERILLKDGPLDASEHGIIRRHPELGERLLSDVAVLQGGGLAVVRWHHERWDGAGYPDGLAGEEIPLAARVFSVADTLDAMTTDRPYRQAGSWTAAIDEIADQAGRQFDPAVCLALERNEDRLHGIFEEIGRAAA